MIKAEKVEIKFSAVKTLIIGTIFVVALLIATGNPDKGTNVISSLFGILRRESSKDNHVLPAEPTKHSASLKRTPHSVPPIVVNVNVIQQQVNGTSHDTLTTVAITNSIPQSDKVAADVDSAKVDKDTDSIAPLPTK